MSVRTVLFAGVGAAALVGLAACSAGRPVAAPTTPPVTISPSASVPAAPVPPTHTSTPTPARSSASPGGGQGGAGNSGASAWSGADFASETRADDRCLPDEKKDQVFSVAYADLNGDGHTDALVTAACPSSTHQNPVSVFVYDGHNRRSPLRLLARIGADHDLTAIKVGAHGQQVTIDARGRSQHTGLCCPDLRITETWTWSGGHLHRTASAQHPL